MLPELREAQTGSPLAGCLLDNGHRDSQQRGRLWEYLCTALGICVAQLRRASALDPNNRRVDRLARNLTMVLPNQSTCAYVAGAKLAVP